MNDIKMYNRLLWDCLAVIGYYKDFKTVNENRLFYKNINLQIEKMKELFFNIPSDKRDKKRLKQLLRIERVLKSFNKKTIKSEQCSYFLKLMDSEENSSYKKALILTCKKYKCNRYNLEKEIDIYF